MNPKASIIIVTYNSAKYIGALLSMLRSQSMYAQCEVLVVDEHSNDATCEIVRSFDGVRLLQSSENRGFAAGMNLGVSHARGEVIVSLDPDISIQDRNLLEHLVQSLGQDPGVGIVAPVIRDLCGRSRFSSGRLPGFLSEFLNYSGLSRWIPFGRYSVSHIEWVSGTVFATRRSMWEKVSGMDEHYFLYVEDMDFCERVRRASYRVIRDTSTEVFHAQSASTRGISRQTFFPQVLFWDIRGILYFCTQHRGRPLYSWVKTWAMMWMCLQLFRFAIQSVVESSVRKEFMAFQLALPWVWRLSYRTLRDRAFNPKSAPYENPSHQ